MESNYECKHCGKQLWKKTFQIEVGDIDVPFIDFCSKKCGIKWANKKIKFTIWIIDKDNQGLTLKKQ